MNEQQRQALLANLSSFLPENKEAMNILAQYVLDKDIQRIEMQATGYCTTELWKAIENAAWSIVSTTGEYEKFAEVFPNAHMEDLKSLIMSQEEKKLWNECKQAFERAMGDTSNMTIIQEAIAKLQKYLETFTRKETEAQNYLSTLQRFGRENTKWIYIQRMKEDVNAYNPSELSMYGITLQDLLDNGINIPNVIQDVWNNQGIDLIIGQTPNSIPSGRTEVYFWGAPGSGKTCTLAAILSQAKALGCFNPHAGNGLMYMTQLSNQFRNVGSTLPKPSPVEVTQELSFDLRDDQMATHPVSLIEISGEIFQCFTNAVNNMPIPDDGHLSSYNSLLSFLTNSDNPKFHFFVIDVTNNKSDYLGLTQIDYLQFAASYFNNNNIFNNKTAGIYILVTKSDLLSDDRTQRTSIAINLLQARYLNFVNSLKSIAYQHGLITSLNDQLPVIPFSIGDVYAQTKCIFDSEMSSEVIQIMQENIARTQVRRRISWFNN